MSLCSLISLFKERNWLVYFILISIEYAYGNSYFWIRYEYRVWLLISCRMYVKQDLSNKGWRFLYKYNVFFQEYIDGNALFTKCLHKKKRLQSAICRIFMILIRSPQQCCFLASNELIILTLTLLTCKKLFNLSYVFYVNYIIGKAFIPNDLYNIKRAWSIHLQ